MVPGGPSAVGVDSHGTARWTVPTPKGFRFRTTLLGHGWLQLASFGHDENFTVLTRVHRLSDRRLVELLIRAAPGKNQEVAVHGVPPDT